MTVPAFSQNSKKATIKSFVRILSDEEAAKLERTNIRTINIPYSKNFNLAKEVTIKKYYEMLLKMHPKSSLKQAIQNIIEVYRQLSKNDPTKLIKMPSAISVFDCGGCGCVTPGKAGYASCTGNTCWCACCP